MTAGEMMLMTALYFAAFVAVAYFTRAKLLRNAGAAAGGAVFGVVALLAVPTGSFSRREWPPSWPSPQFMRCWWLWDTPSCAWSVARRDATHWCGETSTLHREPLACLHP